MVSLIAKERRGDSPHITLRFRYRKSGALAYVSHLDVLRTFTKATLRAGLPLWYSEGFSPHPKLAFAAPLPVGQESLCEYVDVRLAADTSPKEAMAAMNMTLPDGLRITAAGYPAAAFSMVAFAEYRITVITEGGSHEMAATLAKILREKPLTVFKRSKAGARDVDISGNIFSVTSEFSDGAIRLHIVLRAEGGAFMNTDYLLQILRERAGILCGNPLSESATVLRLALLTEDGTVIEEEEL